VSSGSNYGTRRDAELLKRQDKVERGHEVTDTEEEDAALDEEHYQEAHPEAYNDSLQRKDKITKSRQGKQTQVAEPTGTDDETDGDENDHDSDFDGSSWKMIPGPLPQAARVEARQLGVTVNSRAKAITQKYGKSPVQHV
jgi:hypothetical protein